MLTLILNVPHRYLEVNNMTTCIFYVCPVNLLLTDRISLSRFPVGRLEGPRSGLQLEEAEERIDPVDRLLRDRLQRDPVEEGQRRRQLMIVALLDRLVQSAAEATAEA